MQGEDDERLKKRPDRHQAKVRLPYQASDHEGRDQQAAKTGAHCDTTRSRHRFRAGRRAHHHSVHVSASTGSAHVSASPGEAHRWDLWARAVEQWRPRGWARSTSPHALCGNVQTPEARDFHVGAASMRGDNGLARAIRVSAEHVAKTGFWQHVFARELRLRFLLATLTRCRDIVATRYQPLCEECSLRPLRLRYLRAELLEEGVDLGGKRLQDIAHGDSAGVVRDHPAREVDIVLARKVEGHARLHQLVRLHKLLRRRARNVTTSHHHLAHGHTPQITLLVGQRSFFVVGQSTHCARSLLGHTLVRQILQQTLDLGLLIPTDMAAEVHEARQSAILFAREFLKQDPAHFHGPSVVWNHATNEVDSHVTREFDGHARVHVHVGFVPHLHRGRTRCSSTTHS
mmetsp:Transcript_21189/g.68550  ORF Transcript_21189/g.68550 Transcript_21189/m.68550 type:complete len:401 (+) Transcript_21189:301-1503(+)